jgi:holo-[acyl-carrier protein] synthase
MQNEHTLRKIVADLTKRDPEAIHAGLVLDNAGLRGSLKRALLDSQIQRGLGMTSPSIYSASSYGQLEAALLGKESSQDMTLPAPAPAIPPPASEPAASDANLTGIPAGFSVACGVDIEEAHNLPEAADYWEHDFYSTSFSSEEIAYCLLQSDPRVHFAARWAAKEALRKCDPAFLKTELKSVSLMHRKDGSTYLARQTSGTREPLPHAVSISHTDSYAVATVMRVASEPASQAEPPASEPVPAPEVPVPVLDHPAEPEPKRRRLFLAVTALAGGGSALWFLFHYLAA